MQTTPAASRAPPARPSFLPASRWARWALALLLAFALVRGGIWAATQPYFWAPDEDYHFLYVEHLTTQRSLPSPDRPLYPREYELAKRAMRYDDYSAGPRRQFSGDPKASVRSLESLPAADREPREVDRGVGVVHAPLYYLGGAMVNAALGDASTLTRVTAVRWLTSAIGALAVYAAWLLAAQVFRREWLQLAAAALFAVHPVISFMSGIVSNDIAVTAAFAAALALLLFILRTPPRTAQGAWIGGAVAMALLIKSTAVALLPLAALAYAAQALVWREGRRQVWRSAAVFVAVVAVAAGWWYARSVLVYGSLLGSTTDVVPAGHGEHAGLGSVPGLAWEWTRLTYRTYWWHFYAREAPSGGVEFYAPFAVVAVTMAGLAWACVRGRRPGALLSRSDPLPRHVLLMATAVVILYLPPLGTDILRRMNGEGFALVAGRLLLPAYPAAIVLVLAGARQLVPARVLPWAAGGLVAAAAAFGAAVWSNTYVERYFGEASWPELFRRMSFDRPELVTPTAYTLACLAAVACLAAAAAVVIARARQATGRPEAAAQGRSRAATMIYRP